MSPSKSKSATKGTRKRLGKTNGEYAAEYGVDMSTIRNWRAKEYPLDDPEATLALVSQQQKQPAGIESKQAKVDVSTLSDEQLQNPANKAEAQHFQLVLLCRKLVFNNALERGQYIHLDQIKADMTRIGSALKSRMLALPGELPGQLVGKAEHEIQKALFGWVHEALTDLNDSRSKAYGS